VDLDGHLKWLYSAQMRWEAANMTFAAIVGAAVQLRLSEPALHYYSENATNANVVLVTSYNDSSVPTPYIRNLTNTNAANQSCILVVGNPTAQEKTISMDLPLQLAGFDDSIKLFSVRSLWGGDNETMLMKRSSVSEPTSSFSITVEANSFAVVKFSSASSTTTNNQGHLFGMSPVETI
jgi:hypothetical protein